MKYRLLLIAVAFTITSFVHKDMTWVAIGDSITYLNDHLNETGGRVTKGYLTGVTEQLPYIHVTNQGHNGWTAVHIAENIEKLGIEKADVYSVFLGTNDWWHGGALGTLNDYINNTGNSTVYGSFRTIINKLRSMNADARIILITPMQRGDFVYINNMKNNAWGSYKDKNGLSLSRFAGAVDSIGQYEHIETIDLYNNSDLSVKHLVKFKRLKDPQSGAYKDYGYPDYTSVTFNPETDAYPYPPEAMGMTFDGLHPSDKGNELIARLLVKVLKK